MKIEWNIRAFQEIRRLPKVDEMLRQSVEAIAAACGEGYDAHVEAGKTRSRGSVVTSSVPAMIDNGKNNTLLKNIGRGRVS